MRLYMLIAVGGSAGALVRYLIGTMFRSATSAFPLGTLAINLSGSFLLGLAVAILERPVLSDHYRVAFSAGFVGAYTTFSTWSLETLNLLQNGRFGLAALNVLGSVVGGLAAVWFGSVAGRAL